jgi:uncharacterized protein DUF3558
VRAAYAVLPALLLGLGACSSPGDASPDRASPAGTSPTVAGPGGDSSTAPRVWNPCGDLAATRVGRALGERVTRETGTADTPRCAFLPVTKGGPALNVTYAWFAGGFERAWRRMGVPDGRVRDLRLPGADHARLVVNRSRGAVLVTGFVQTGDLVEIVNAIGLSPDEHAAVTSATTGVLRTLVRHAPAHPMPR